MVLFPLQGVKVRSLVGELRSHMPRSVAKKKKFAVCFSSDEFNLFMFILIIYILDYLDLLLSSIVLMLLNFRTL